jgi:SAM-dependent methyltransferase
VSAAGRLADAVAWHDVECGGYAADLPLWRELAAEGGGPLLDLGCGTGRVALDLAVHGHAVTAVDSDRELVDALAARARAADLPVEASVLDVRSLWLPRGDFAVAFAPMQVAQLLGGAQGRAAMLERVRAHLRPGGLLAVALAEPFEGLPAEGAEPPLPDMREHEGWVLSSAPVAVRPEAGDLIAIDRLRQAVAPDGELAESLATVVLESLPAAELEAQAEARGYLVRPRRRVPETPAYVASTVVMLEAS